MGIGKRIKEAREAKNITQKELADLVGVTASAITNYENEVSHPKEPVLYRLFNALQVDPNYLFQDCFSSAPLDFSSETRAIATAYEAADPGTQAAVRKLLDVKKPPHIPDMEKVRREAEAFASKLREPTKK